MTQISRLVLDAKSDSNKSLQTQRKNEGQGAGGGRDRYRRRKVGACDLGLAKDRGRVGAVTRDLGALWVLGTRGSTLLPSPAGTGSGSSSRSHFPSLEAFRTIMRL